MYKSIYMFHFRNLFLSVCPQFVPCNGWLGFVSNLKIQEGADFPTHFIHMMGEGRVLDGAKVEKDRIIWRGTRPFSSSRQTHGCPFWFILSPCLAGDLSEILDQTSRFTTHSCVLVCTVMWLTQDNENKALITWVLEQKQPWPRPVVMDISWGEED